MIIVRNEQRIVRLKKISQWANLIGFLFLLAGLIVLFLPVEYPLVLQTMALAAGWLISQIGIYLTHRYVRSPRPDEVLDKAIKKFSSKGRIYHYILPTASHVLLTAVGPIIFVLKYQGGQITFQEGKWRQKGIGFRRFFGQEGIGNPSREAETMVSALANFIRKEAPEIDEVPIGVVIVFTSDQVKKSLDVAKAPLPAMHYTKVARFLKQTADKSAALPRADYEHLQAAFDNAAGDILSESK